MKKKHPEIPKELIQQILENYPSAFMSVINKDFSIGYTAGGAFSEQNINPGSSIGKTLKEVFGDQASLMKSYYTRTFKGESCEFELFIYGQYQLYKTIPLPDEDGNIPYILSAVENITEKKKAEISLKESEERYRLLFEKSTDPILIIDGSTFIDCNQATAKFLRYKSIKKVIGKTPWELSPSRQPDGKSSKSKAIEMIKLAESKGYHRFEWIHEDALGEELWLDISLTHLIVDGKTRVYTVWRDITKEKEIDQALKDINERYDLAMHATSDGLFDWNLVANEIYYSPGWKSMLGYADHELPNDFSVWENQTYPDDVKRSFAMLQELLEQKRDRFELEFRMKHKDGHWVDILSRADAVFDKNGKGLRVVGTHVDITEKKRIERAIQESENRFRSLAQNSPVGIYTTDEKGNCTYANALWLEMAGMSLEEAKGKGWLNGLHPEDRETISDKWYKSVESSGKWGYEYRFESKDGKITWVYGSAAPYYNDQGVCIGYIGSNIDITERKLAEEERSLHRKNLEALVSERTKELEEKNAELERFNKLFVGREFRIKELRDQVKELKEKIPQSEL